MSAWIRLDGLPGGGPEAIAAVLARRYFAGRADGLHPPDPAEELLVATT